MDVVQRWKEKIAWYQPTEDTGSWREFAETTYKVDYTQATVETLKKVAWQSQKITSGPDRGMWADRAARLQKFLNGDMGLSEENPIEKEAIQYDFVACFLNPYQHAAHNEDLWQSIDEAAIAVLKENIEPEESDELLLPVTPVASGWKMGAIALILLSAFKTINLSYYRPTEDTGTWAYFQNIMFDLSLFSNFRFVYRHAYLLSTVESVPDKGMWETMAGAARAFLDANLGRTPGTAREEFELAIDFCKILEFKYQHAAHNEGLFKAYEEAFAKAKKSLRIFMERHT